MVDCSSRSKSLGGMLAKENEAGERRTNEDWQSCVRGGKLALRPVINVIIRNKLKSHIK